MPEDKTEHEAFTTIDEQVRDTRIAGVNGRTVTGLLVGALGLFMKPDSPERERLVRMSGALLSVGLSEQVVDRMEEGRPLVERRSKDGGWEAHPGFPRANGLPIPQDQAPRGLTLGDLLASAAVGEDLPQHGRSRFAQNRPSEPGESVDTPNTSEELDDGACSTCEDSSGERG